MGQKTPFMDGHYLRKRHMIIDIHTHIFPDDVRRDKESVCNIEPNFCQLYESPKASLVSGSQIVDAMDADKVDKSVVFGFPWEDPGRMREHNDYVGEEAAQSKGRLVPFCCVNPADSGAAREAARCLDAGFAGVGELAFYASGFGERELDQLAPVMEVCRDKNAPVLIHTNEPVGHAYPGKAPILLKQIYDLVSRFSENRLVLAHWGGGIFFYALLKKEVKDRLKNVWVDTAASCFLYDAAVYPMAAKIWDPEKILFGSDYPLIRPGRYIKEISASGVSEKEARLILGANAEKLLGA